MKNPRHKLLRRPPVAPLLSRHINLIEGQWTDLGALTRSAHRLRSLLLNTTVLDISHLGEFENLEELAVSEYCMGGFDLARLPKLKRLWVDVGPSRPIQPGGGYELIDLGVAKATRPWTEWIMGLPQLESLRLDQPRSLPSELPPTLRRLELSGARGWDKDEIALSGGTLQELHLTDMRGMSNLMSFKFADDLRVLWLEDCPDLRSLAGPQLSSDAEVHVVGSTPKLTP